MAIKPQAEQQLAVEAQLWLELDFGTCLARCVPMAGPGRGEAAPETGLLTSAPDPGLRLCRLQMKEQKLLYLRLINYYKNIN